MKFKPLVKRIVFYVVATVVIAGLITVCQIHRVAPAVTRIWQSALHEARRILKPLTLEPHLCSREAFISWAVAQLSSPSSFQPAQKDLNSDGSVLYVIQNQTYVELANTQRVYFVTHSIHDEDYPTKVPVKDTAVLRHKDRFFISTEHICGAVLATDSKEFLVSLEDFFKATERDWKAHADR